MFKSEKDLTLFLEETHVRQKQWKCLCGRLWKCLCGRLFFANNNAVCSYRLLLNVQLFRRQIYLSDISSDFNLEFSNKLKPFRRRSCIARTNVISAKRS